MLPGFDEQLRIGGQSSERGERGDARGLDASQPQLMCRFVQLDVLERDEHTPVLPTGGLSLDCDLDEWDCHRRAVHDEVLDATDGHTLPAEHLPVADVRVASGNFQIRGIVETSQPIVLRVEPASGAASFCQ